MQKTFRIRKEDVVRRWYQLDAKGVILGKLAVKAAVTLMGRHRPTFTPGVDSGDFVVITNAREVRVTGKKETGKIYVRHSLYPGGRKETVLGELRKQKPQKIVQEAVRRMLPKSHLGRMMLKRLKVYPGPEHPHTSQKPELLAVG
jgi:large subunit ribosomal protein L13